MAELSKELYSKLLLADSLEEVTELLKAGGCEYLPAEEVGRRCSSAAPRTAWS